jgi:hypothetical protein
MTIRVVVTNKAVTLPQTSRVLAIGDATLKRRAGTGFAVKLARNGQKRVLLYLTYRGPLPLSIASAGGKSKIVSVFYVT